ncbi:MAG: diguanylate cyclase, partial [Deltaproteobacteria bacterium]|nr:diguanylate cyclase [Deltaproteobacteria bacterium]
MKALDSEGAPPEDLAVFSIDVNGLKTVNDSLGHDAGDELIRGAADCISAAFGQTGKCYRTGGDEFVVLA